jgi:BlaI family penicillinase repressor
LEGLKLKMRIRHTFGSSLRQIGPLEERVLEALWKRGSATAREIVDEDFKNLAYNTVMTTLDRLFKKGLLTRSGDGRPQAFRYTARFSREELHREAAEQALCVLLDSNPVSAAPLSFMVEVVGERDAQLLDDLSKLVESKRREINRRDQKRKDTK